MARYTNEVIIEYLLWDERLRLEAAAGVVDSDCAPPDVMQIVEEKLKERRRSLAALSYHKLSHQHTKVMRQHWEIIALPADFSHWARMPYWTVDEAAALLLGKDPSELAEQDELSAPFADIYWDLIEVIKRARGIAELPEKMRPPDVIAWAERIYPTYPRKLMAEVSKFYPQQISAASLEMNKAAATPMPS